MHYLQVQFSGGKNDMLSSLLLEGLYTRVGLTQQLHAAYKLWHISRDGWLEGNADDGWRL